MITVVLNAYKRTNFLDKQLQAVFSQSVKPKKILVWQNKAESVPDDLKNKVTFSECNQNLGVWARFSYALNADTEYVCILDDDTIPGSRWFENCLNTIQVHQGLLGARGLRFLSKKCYEPYVSYGWDNPNEATVQVDIVGHSWFFKREWLGAFWRELPPIGHSKLAGEDMHFSYALQKHLGISTYVPPHPKDERDLWGSLPETAYSLGSNSVALSTSDFGMKRFNEAYSFYVKSGFEIVGENTMTKPIVIGKGMRTNPFLRQIVRKYPFLKQIAVKSLALLKKLNIHI